MTEGRGLPARDRRLLIAIVLAAATARLLIAPFPIFYHADEVWQYLEPAHGLVTGRWAATWEFREGIRTWLLPAFFSGPIWLSRRLGQADALAACSLSCALVSLAPVAAATHLGLRLSRAHGMAMGLVAAFWYEMLFFSVRPLSEPIANALILSAAALLLPPVVARRTPLYAIAGLLLGLAVAVRFQNAPAIAVLAFCGCGARLRSRWLPLVGGAAAGLMLDGIVDGLLGHQPFAWLARNVAANLIENRSARYGTSPPLAYLAMIVEHWKGWCVPILCAAALGARRYPALLAVAAAHLAAHSLIPHKEYRFVLLSTDLLVLLAAIGSVDLVAIAGRGGGRRGGIAAALAVVAWTGASASLAATRPFKPAWHSGRELIEISRAAGRSPGICGLAFYRPQDVPTPAYVLYGRATPIYLFAGDEARRDALAASSSFNAAIAPPRLGGELPGYRLARCAGASVKGGDEPAFCLFTREGGCSGDAPGDEVNAVYRRLDK